MHFRQLIAGIAFTAASVSQGLAADKPLATFKVLTPKMALMTNTSTVRLRTCSRVGHVTFFSSEYDSAT